MKAAKRLGAALVSGMMCVGTANALALLDSSMYSTITADADGNVTVGGVNFVAQGLPGAVFTVGSNGGFSGLGVFGRQTNGEIDNLETVTMSWGYYAAIQDFSVALLYNGPEFNDVAEVAMVTASIEGGGTVVGQLTVDAANDEVATWAWSNVVGSVPSMNQDPATQFEGGAWKVANPFGNLRVNQLVFTAIPGFCGTGGGTCTNQSDYVLSSVNVVPEPGTYSLLLAGLAAVGFIARRRRIPR